MEAYEIFAINNSLVILVSNNKQYLYATQIKIICAHVKLNEK
jgi:hypothetical protein